MRRSPSVLCLFAGSLPPWSRREESPEVIEGGASRRGSASEGGSRRAVEPVSASRSPVRPKGAAPDRASATVSVIVPLRNESPDAAERFTEFSPPARCELLVSDAGSDLETADAFRALGGRILPDSGSRGARLARAARKARGNVLFFLHADSRPPPGALSIIQEALDAGADAGAFSLAYDDDRLAMRWVAWWANRRSRLAKLPFGDQGIFCRRETYEAAGGFRDLPICDDLDLVRRLRRAGRFVVRPEKTFTSARRYVERGTLRQVLRNWKVIAGYFAGVAPETVRRWYEKR